MKVSSSVTLEGVRYSTLTDSMKRSIERSIQLQLGADSVTATYEPDWRRQRGRRLASGDTVVKWEAVFHSAAAAASIRQGDAQQFEQGLADRLNANSEFYQVTAKAEPFATPGPSFESHRPRCPSHAASPRSVPPFTSAPAASSQRSLLLLLILIPPSCPPALPPSSRLPAVAGASLRALRCGQALAAISTARGRSATRSPRVPTPRVWRRRALPETAARSRL